MKKLVVKKGIECKACLSCVRACSESFFKTFDQGLSCIQVIQKDDVVKPVVCIQCGKCAKVCEAGAIKQNAKGTYTIDKKLCVNCGKCAEVCPMQVIVRGPEFSSKCIACGICVKACPMEMLEIVEK